MEEEQLSEYNESGSSESGFEGRAKQKGKEALKKAGDKAKKGAKTLWKKLPTKVKLIILAVIAGIILLLILIAGFCYVLNIITGENSSNSKKSLEVVASGGTLSEETTEDGTDTTYNQASSLVGGLFVNTENGLQLNIKDNENLQEIFSELEVDVNNTEDWELIKELMIYYGCEESDYDEEEWKCLLTFLQAEAATLYPDMRTKDKIGTPSEDGKINGIIQIQRNSTKEGKTPQLLQYLKYDEFMNQVNESNINVINYFTIDKEGNIVIAKWEYEKNTYTYSGNVPEDRKGTNAENYYISTEKLNYKTYISKYAMPFEFLDSLLIITENPEFCKEIARLAFNSKIVITIQEEYSETNTSDVTSYTDTSRTYVYADFEQRYRQIVTNLESNSVINDINERAESGNNYLIDQDNKGYSYEDENKYTVTKKTVTQNNTYKVELTEVDIWYAKIKKTYGDAKKVNNPTDTGSITEEGEFGEKSDVITSSKDKELLEELRESKDTSNNKTIKYIQNSEGENIQKIESWYECSANVDNIKRESKTSYTETITTDKTEYKLDENPTTQSKVYEKNEQGEYEKFLKQYDENKNAREQIESVDSWLYELLEQNENTVDLVEVVKYLKWRYENPDAEYTGDFSLDGLDLCEISSFNSLQSSDSLIQYATNFINYYEGTGEIVEKDGKKYYKAYLDTLPKNPVVTIGHGLTEYEIEHFREYGIISLKEGDLIEVELVDKIQQDIIEGDLVTVKSLCPNLNDYQYVALLSAYYNCRSLVTNFNENYKKYWKESDNKYKKTIPNVEQITKQLTNKTSSSECEKKNDQLKEIINCDLYTNGWANYCHSGGNCIPGLVKRRCYEWIIFQYGYDITSGKYIECGAIGEKGTEGKEIINYNGNKIELKTYTNSSGRRFILYNQNEGPWASKSYCGSTISKVGCSITSLAVVLSGYDYNYTPDTWSGAAAPLRNILNNNLNPKGVKVTTTYLKGGSCYSKPFYGSKLVINKHKTNIINTLNEGGLVYFHVFGNAGGGNNRWAYSQHWMSLLDINENGTKVYVSSVHSKDTGWADIDEILKSLCCYSLIK